MALMTGLACRSRLQKGIQVSLGSRHRARECKSPSDTIIRTKRRQRREVGAERAGLRVEDMPSVPQVTAASIIRYKNGVPDVGNFGLEQSIET